MPAYRRGPYKSREASLTKVMPFKPILTQMVDDARANLGKLDTDAAAKIIPDVPEGAMKVPVGTFELLKKIKYHYGALGVRTFKAHFGSAKKIYDKQRLKKLQYRLIRGEITRDYYVRTRARCFYYVWSLLPERMQRPTAENPIAPSVDCRESDFSAENPISNVNS